MRYVLLALIAIVGCTAVQEPVAHQEAPPCGEPDDFVLKLREGYLEEVRGLGITAGGAVIELFRTEGGETWSLVATNGEVSCLLATGESWQQVAPSPKGRAL